MVVDEALRKFLWIKLITISSRPLTHRLIDALLGYIKGNVVLQKISAYATLLMILTAIVLNLLPINEFSITADSFESGVGQILFLVGLASLIFLISIHFVAMFVHMIFNGRWLWLIGTFFLVFAVTVPYYFIFYRKSKSH